ncbi:catalase [Psychrobacillus psychrodurans]|uniref:catalase n=1 Tax=Psychrobacillus psychrodurans TaxID=126157 RepID=UPI0008EEBD7C|nr:catalase [Psychrobacillus psychrodurans]MCZ8540255.1 catalase [Psychrobacillus psychrodurans]SFM62018.1 catalase [Psychrobacillus psychrodurans]
MSNTLPQDAINTLEQLQGKFPGHRRAHAKGEFYEAVFTPNGKAIPYTTAPHLQSEPVPATVRFSNSPPDPTAADFLSPAKGMSIHFHQPDGSTSHQVCTTIPMFITKDPKTFIEMLKILGSHKTGVHSIDLGLGIVQLLTTFPEHKKTLLALKEQLKQPPISYAALHYYPIHAFYLVNAEGKRQAIKYEWRPLKEKKSSSFLSSINLSTNYLSEDLEKRLDKGTVSFELFIRLAEDTDATDDPTDTWPTDRQKILIGQLTINKKIFPTESLLFDPTIVGKGIELPDDPILHFRHESYAVSYDRRNKENKKTP